MRTRIFDRLVLATVAMTTAVLITPPIANAQNHTGRRRGAILGGLAGAALGVAIGDKGDNETAGALIGGAAGAVAGGIIGDQRDKQRRGVYHGYPPHGYPVHGSTVVVPHASHSAAGLPTPATGYPVYSTQTPYQPTFEPPVYQSFSQPQRADQNRFIEPSPFSNPAGPNLPPESLQYGPSVLDSPRTDATRMTTASPLTHDEVAEMSMAGMSDAMVIRQINRRGLRTPLDVRGMIDLYNRGVSEDVLEAMQN